MEVAVAGAHGKIAMRLARRLVARGVNVVGLIRNPEHGEDIRGVGATPVLCDLEHADVPQIAEAISGADAVVFAAGAGPGSGAQRKLTIDRDGAIKLLHASASADVRCYLMISSIGAEVHRRGKTSTASISARRPKPTLRCTAENGWLGARDPVCEQW